MTIVLAAAIAATLTGALHIYTDYKGPRWATYIFKPATMLIIIGLLITQRDTASSYSNLILIGLLFSLLGDIFLMLPSKPLLPGLGSFLLAHFFYVGAFHTQVDIEWNRASIISLVAIAAWCGIIWRVMHAHLGKLYIPGGIYYISISTMVFLSLQHWFSGVAGSEYLVIGALLFYASDTALAFNRIRAPYRSAQLLILSTYYPAQFLIALSVILGGH